MLFNKLHPEYRKKEVQNAKAKATPYLENKQNPDGSWYTFIMHTSIAIEKLKFSLNISYV